MTNKVQDSGRITADGLEELGAVEIVDALGTRPYDLLTAKFENGEVRNLEVQDLTHSEGHDALKERIEVVHDE